MLNCTPLKVYFNVKIVGDLGIQEKIANYNTGVSNVANRTVQVTVPLILSKKTVNEIQMIYFVGIVNKYSTAQ